MQNVPLKLTITFEIILFFTIFRVTLMSKGKLYDVKFKVTGLMVTTENRT